MHILRIIIIILLLLSLTGCDDTDEATITIYAASSLIDAFEQLADAFERQNPSVTVLRNYAASSQLALQIIEGAPADVFASANPNQMDVVFNEGLISSQQVQFASNELILITPIGNPANINDLNDITQPNVRILLAEAVVPIREYTDAVLTAYGTGQSLNNYPQAVQSNVVSEEGNVRLIAAKVALGEVDAGFVYRSDVTTDIAEQVVQIEIPPEYNVNAAYWIAPIESGNSHADVAEAFIEFVLSPTGQEILGEWGFSSPQ